MSDINKVGVKITGDESGLKKATKAAQKDIKSIGTAAISMSDIIKGSAIGSAIGTMIGNAIAGITRAVSSEMDAAFKRFDALNNYSKVMSNLRVGTEDSSTSIAILDQKLRGLPTSLSDAALGVQRFTAANGNIQASTDMFLAFNNAILAGGAATATQETAMEQLIQAYSKGKADAQEWRAMLIAMPAQLKQIAEAMGYTSTAIGGDFQTALNKGEISMNDFALTAIKLNKEGANGFASFSQQAKNATNGVQTAIANLKIAIQRGLADILSAIGQSNVSGFFAGIANAVSTATRYIAAFVAIVKQAVAWVAALFGWGSKGSTDSIVEETGATATALESASDGAESTADGLNDAAGAAKKLRQQLAGFDEMNVLQDKETSSGSGGSGGAGTGGAGSSSILDYQWDTSDLDKAGNKIEELVEKIKSAFKKIFGTIDFEALGKSLQKLAKGLKNAINGALAVGKKFVTEFIQPIAKFTLENALPRIFTAIGDALASIDFNKIANAAGHVFSGLASAGQVLLDIWAKINEILAPIGAWLATFVVPPALEAIAFILNTISAVIGGIWNAVSGFYDGAIKPLLSAIGAMLEPVLNFLNQTLGALNENNRLWDTLSGIVSGVASFILGMLRPAFEGLAWVISNVVAPAVEFLTNVVSTVLGWFKNLLSAIFGVSQEETRLSQTVSENTKQWDDNKDGILQATEALNHWDDAVMAVNNAELKLINSQEELQRKTEALNEYVKVYGRTQEELTQLYHDNKLETLGLSDDALVKLKKAIIEAENAEIKMRAAQQEKSKADVAEQEMVSAIWQKYNDLGRQLVEVAKQQGLNSDEYLKTKKAMDEARTEAEKYGKVNASIIDWTKAATKAVGEMGNTSFKAASQLRGSSLTLGSDIGQGLINGLNNKNGAIYNAGYSAGRAAIQGIQKGTNSHSPSKAAMEVGGWVDEGLAIGLEKDQTLVEKTATEIGNTLIGAINSAPKFKDLGTIDIATQFSELTARAQGTLELQNEATNDAIDQLTQAIGNLAEKDQRVVVKIGEETLIDKIVDGINNASRMRNQTVINL